MTSIYLHLHTPLNIEEESVSLLPPLFYQGTLYFLKEKKFHYALEILGYFQQYIYFTRENGYEQVSKWLVQKNLYNADFLQEVSQYWIDGVGQTQRKGYIPFAKNACGKPFMPEGYFEGVCKNFIIYSCIKENKDFFNQQTCQALDFLEKELSGITNAEKFSSRKTFLKNNAAEILLESFFSSLPGCSCIEKKFEQIQNLRFSDESDLYVEDLEINKIGGIYDYSDSNFRLSNLSNKECLKQGRNLKVKVSSEKGFYSENPIILFLEEIRFYSDIFAYDKMRFDKNYLNSLKQTEAMRSLEKNRELSMSLTQNEDSFYNFQQNFYQNTLNPYLNSDLDSNFDEKIFYKNFAESKVLNTNENANIYLSQPSEIRELSVLLNLERSNLRRINDLFYSISDSLETKLIKFIFPKRNNPSYVSGFASMDF